MEFRLFVTRQSSVAAGEAKAHGGVCVITAM
jgi:hypothetical protein